MSLFGSVGQSDSRQKLVLEIRRPCCWRASWLKQQWNFSLWIATEFLSSFYWNHWNHGSTFIFIGTDRKSDNFEAVVWSILWGWSLFNILKLDFDRLLIWIKKPLLRWKHSTLVSVLPLAMFQPEFIKLDKNARFSPIVKFSGFSTYPIFHSGRQHPAKSSRKQQIEKNASGVCYFLALTKRSELVEVIDLARYSPNTNLGGRKKATRWSFSFGSGKNIFPAIFFRPAGRYHIFQFQ